MFEVVCLLATQALALPTSTGAMHTYNHPHKLLKPLAHTEPLGEFLKKILLSLYCFYVNRKCARS